MNTQSDRRGFFKTVGAGVIAAGYTATSAGYAANETLQVGCIGTGGRCLRLMEALAQVKGVKITAVCDIWDYHLAQGKKRADPQAFATKDYHALLSRKDVDAVIIGTPDHWHVPITVDACAAGKDVYVEKPLTHERSEGAAVIEAQNKHRRIVQVGTQQRSMPHYHEAFKLIKNGALGKIYKVHLTWNRNAPRHGKPPVIDPATVDWKRFLGNVKEQPFDAYRFRGWRWFWDFGGGIFTDLMTHKIDIANWYLDLGHPETAVSAGDHFTAKGLWETPDTVQTVLRYPNKGVQVYFEGTFCNANHGAMCLFMGSEASLYVDRGRFEVIPELAARGKPPIEHVVGKGPKGQDFYDKPDGEVLHLANWVECIRSREKSNAPAEAGVAAADAAHLANQALRSGGVAQWK